MMRKVLRQVQRRVGKSPLGSAAGYGTPGLPLDRGATRAKLGFDVTQEPVTAVQLSRGKAEAHLLFEIALLVQDLGRFAADVLLFYTQEFAFPGIAGCIYHRLVDHAAEAQSGRVRIDPRPLGNCPGVFDRGAGNLRQAAFRLPARPAIAEIPAVSQHRHRIADVGHSAARD